MKRKPYMPGKKMVTSAAMAQMRRIAFDDMPKEARQTISLQDRLVDDDARLAAAAAKRQRKNERRLKG